MLSYVAVAICMQILPYGGGKVTSAVAGLLNGERSFLVADSKGVLR